jgi:PTH1 family peptidyl-tRNA hydrolase
MGEAMAEKTPVTDAPIRAIAALGNPGRKYAETRHNVGWMVVDLLAKRQGASWQTRFQGEFTKLRFGSTDVAVLKPGSFMNLSGHPVQAMCAFLGIAPEELLVIHDDLDLAFGRTQIKAGGGHGGHNGLRSIIAQFAQNGFVRVRVGIGRPDEADAADHVLSPFLPHERTELGQVIERAAEAVDAIVQDGVRPAMNRYNTVVKEKPPAEAKAAK